MACASRLHSCLYLGRVRRVLTGLGVVAAPWMLGQVVGGIIGAHILASVKASIVRNILITMLLASSLKLIGRGIETLAGIDIPVL